MTNVLDDPTLYLDSFLPTSSTPEISDFSDSLALLEQEQPNSSLTTPPLPLLSDPTTLDDDSTFSALSDSELSSLLHDPQPRTPTSPTDVVANKKCEIVEKDTSDSDPNSPTPSACSTDDDTVVPTKRRRTSSSFSKTISPTLSSYSPPSSSTVNVTDAISGCSDCDHAANTGISRKQLEQRLRLSAEENGRLRKRVADLMQENRGLRGHVEQLGRACTAMQNALQHGAGMGNGVDEVKGKDGGVVSKDDGEGGMMVGLATVSKEMAKQLGGMVVIGGKEKKRRRKKVGTAMACVMFMMAAMVGIPNYLSDGKGMLALPDQSLVGWNENGLVPLERPRRREGVPRLCEYVARNTEKKAIADHSGDDKEMKVGEEKNGAGSLFVKIDDDDTNSVLRKEEEGDDVDSGDEAEHGQQFSYVLCKDSVKAIASAKSCMKAEKEGKACPKENVISLIMPMPAAAFGEVGEENETRIEGKTVLAEVKCKVSSVRKLMQRRSGVSAVQVGGRVIASS